MIDSSIHSSIHYFILFVGVTSFVEDGLAGLWAQSSRILMNLLSSQVTLHSCGLFVLNKRMKQDDPYLVYDSVDSGSKADDSPAAAVDVLELSVRDLASSYAGTNSNIDLFYPSSTWILCCCPLLILILFGAVLVYFPSILVVV